jgi:O-antigen/teichoic acid export membrane protein
MSPYSLGQFKRSASSLFLVQILNLIISWSSPFLLAIWANVDDVAIFSVAYRTAMSTSIILLAVNSITAPKFATLYRQGNLVELHRIVIWSTRLMLALCVPVVGFLFFFSDWIMSLFGDGFVSGGEVLIVLVIGQFVNVLTGSVVLLLTMTGNEKALIISTALSSLVMLLLSALLIPLYGALGAAVAQAVSVTCLMLLNTWFVKRALGFVPMNILAKLKGS